MTDNTATLNIGTKYICHGLTPLDIVLDNSINYIRALGVKCATLECDLWLAKQKLDEVYYRRGVSY